MSDPVLASLQTALSVRPDDTALRLAVARRLLDGGDLPAALAEAAEALRRDPPCDEARDFMLAALAGPATPSGPPPSDAALSSDAALPADPAPLPDAAVPADPAPLALPPGGSQPATEAPSDSGLAGPAGPAAVEPPGPAAVEPLGPAAAGPGDDGGAGSSEEFDWLAAEDDLGEVVGPRFVGDETAEPAIVDAYETERPQLCLADVGGMETVKDRLDVAFLAPMRNPQLRRLYGKSLRGGLLLYGPPGCGKTFIARAVAGELGAGFIAVGISEVLNMYIGESERNLHELFVQARRQAPCVLFLDEVDALGQKRSHSRNSGLRGVINQLLTEMDSVAGNNDGVFVLAATNQPWDVDTALRRPGRFDRTVLVLPPDPPARRAILGYHLRDRPVERIDLDRLVAATEGFSGADLAHVCETAAERALMASARSGEARLMDMGDFDAALGEIRSSTGPWFASARGVAMFANEGGAYDDLVAYFHAHPEL